MKYIVEAKTLEKIANVDSKMHLKILDEILILTCSNLFTSPETEITSNNIGGKRLCGQPLLDDLFNYPPTFLENLFPSLYKNHFNLHTR